MAGMIPAQCDSGMREKDITLDVSQTIENILEDEYGYEVLMTRRRGRLRCPGRTDSICKQQIRRSLCFRACQFKPK